jgi:2-polyprenyl-3-methyl-5-hydroxy-6-metoxy-1,4-benzoquinol methylase
MIRVSSIIQQRVTATYGQFVERLSGIAAEKCARDVLNEEKAHDQIALICRICGVEPGDLRGRRILDVGSGFGIFVAVARREYGMEALGIEPATHGFDSSFAISREIMQDTYGLDPEFIVNAYGENLPFQAETFDFVFSSTVLEHTNDPEQVLREAVRVCRASGHIQFVFPNYGSFFEGHYSIPWIPYLPHRLGRLWVRCWKRNPTFIDTLKFTNYYRTQLWASRLEGVRIISVGREIFKERMYSLGLKDWGGLGRLKPWLELMARLKLIPLATWVLDNARAFDPIILTLKREARIHRAKPDNQAIYDLHWPDWVDMKRHGPSSRWQRSLIFDRFRSLDRTTIRSILDYGCGEGTTTATLAEHFPEARITGIDQSSAGITCARSNYAGPNLTFEFQPSSAPAENTTYDLVTCLEVLEHVPDWQTVTDELCARTNRYLLVSFPTGRMRSFEINIGHFRNFPPGVFESHMRSRGFRPVSRAYAGFPFYSPIFREVCNLANSGGHRLTVGRYNWKQKSLGSFIYLSFRYLSTRHRFGDQFCGLFERIEPAA